MKVLVADKLPGRMTTELRALGHEVIVDEALSSSTLPAALAASRAEALVVRSTEVTAAAFEAAPSLSLVIRAGAGTNTIDTKTASRRGVYVTNCPGKNAIAVAELVIGMLIALDRRLVDATTDLKQGRWRKKEYGKARGLYGRTLALVGFGAIAQEVASRAAALGMRVVAWSPSLDETRAEAAGVERASSLPELLACADALSVHVPYRKATHHMIGAAELSQMKPGALFIHTARGGVVDDAALAEAVREGRLRAAVDVLEGEPEAGEAEVSAPLLSLPGVVATPHVGASTDQASEAIGDEVVRIVRDFETRGVVHNCVNLVRERAGGFVLVVRHYDRVGVLARVLDALRAEELSVKEMLNVVFASDPDAEGAASATISIEREPSSALVERLRADDAILAVDVRAMH